MPLCSAPAAPCAASRSAAALWFCRRRALSPCALLCGRRCFGRVGGVCGLASGRLAPFPPPSPPGSFPPSPVGPVGPLCGILMRGAGGSLSGPAPFGRSRCGLRRALPRPVWWASPLRCAASGPCRAVCAPAAPRALVVWSVLAALRAQVRWQRWGVAVCRSARCSRSPDPAPLRWGRATGKPAPAAQPTRNFALWLGCALLSRP